MEQPTVEIPRTSVYQLSINPGQVSTYFCDSLVMLAGADVANGLGVYKGRLGHISGANISKGRNDLVSAFLKTDGEWAWFCDSDMVFPPEALIRLLVAAQHANTKVIGGLCCMVTDDGLIPTLYQYNEAPGPGYTRVHLDYPDNSVLQVAATGTAFLLVHRDVLEKMRSESEHEFAWFAETVRRENWVSEDVEFCLRANALGFSVFVDCTLEIGHHKQGKVWYPSDIRKPARKDRPIVAIVPVKDRLDLTSDIVHQLGRQPGVDEIIVCDNGSQQKTRNWLESQPNITLLDCPDVGIHEMWNRGISHVIGERGSEHAYKVRFAFLNNDLRLGADCLRIMSRALDDEPEYVAMSANYDGRDFEAGIQPTTDICANRYDGTGGLAGFAFMVDGSWFTNGYRFPEQCKWWYGDNDLVMAVNYSDRKAGIAINAKVEHLDGGSKTAGDWFDPKLAEQLEADRDAFEARWTAFLETIKQNGAQDEPGQEWDPAAAAKGELT